MFTSLLQVLFIGLKLANVITWSWFWVLSPMWIAACIWLFFFLVLVITKIKTGN